MNVKIDTKEKFTVITPQETVFAANMTAEINNLLLQHLQKDIPHIVLNMSIVNKIANTCAVALANLQQQFYEKKCSFVICDLQENVKKVFAENDLLDVMNITPTESEAWDILQMEEVERELFGEDNL